ncbi:hypothetical protein PIB30_086737 [Stylosanthes scabra]|uniref:Uncharacterized protein n=1 Tax=Stylosanthes scabra TaxID=79078 RepID=A0ABU6YS18_9FABA|nr:hypothetical protein [Stylosanthes scabra]
MGGGGKRPLSSIFLLGLKCDSRETVRRYDRSPSLFILLESEVHLQRDGGRFGSPSCFPPGYDQRDGPLVSYQTRSGWPYNRSNELIGHRNRHASFAFDCIVWVQVLGLGSSLDHEVHGSMFREISFVEWSPSSLKVQDVKEGYDM